MDTLAGVEPEAVADASASSPSLHAEVLARLRDHIVEGKIAEGARVPEKELCALFGISRTPLREALKVLASEGLIELLPNRGARVRPLDVKEIRELFDLMGGLEALAGRLACENLTEEEFLRIEAAHHEMYGCYLRRDLSKYFKYNQDIHRMIVEAAHNSVLAATYAAFVGRLRRLRYSANLDRHRDRWGEAMREHEAILDALRRRAPQDLSEILFHHLRNKQIAAVEYSTDLELANAEALKPKGKSRLKPMAQPSVLAHGEDIQDTALPQESPPR
ncbi:GntR family transcriptional regulator [Beijerinckia indica]|uniref:Transcriptional regulator, GntR family n=1 Tax=Beijerinckia indica subsp. indica (strain ATCC 9039 / DSM 1715 / NCIMB 8712) TaxID=395963 RepID=B2IFI4_BEII9|nr:GntR family transcriptional regulator [Beijerinckia indica]ACB97080.1 transcriptional regulator, GntR family [Beijerinckia indica subsp. indica ATCC 9039]